jgi:hypothetical protein
MTERSPDQVEEILQERQLARTRERNSDFAERMGRFKTEVVDSITPATHPKEVYAALWALSRFMYDYADPAKLEDVDPSTASELGDVALTIFGNFSGLYDGLTNETLDELGSEGDTLAARYMEGFPTSLRSITAAEQTPE